jgi:hypothetical protein
METAESNPFTWIPFYEELANCLVPYRSHSKDLVMMLEELRAEGLPITRLDDQDPAGSRFPLSEIDPFTFRSI